MSNRLLIVAPVTTHPVTAGSGARLRLLADELSGLGMEVFFAHIGMSGSCGNEMRSAWEGRLFEVPYKSPSVHGTTVQRWRARFRKWLPRGLYAAKYNCDLDDWYDHAGGEQLQAYIAGQRFAVVIVTHVFLSRLFLGLPGGIRRILDAQDRFADRWKTASASGRDYDWYSTTRRQERRGLRRADAVLTVSSEDANAIWQETGRPAFFCGPTVQVPESVPRFEARGPAVLFVGNSNAPNRGGLRWFLDDVWPRLINENPSARLLVAGSVCRGQVAPANVELLGTVPDLNSLYACCRVAINPVESGTGVAVKCIEALGQGVPVVTTPSGARSLSEAEGLTVAASVDSFVSCVNDLLRNGGRWKAASEDARGYAIKWNRAGRQGLSDALALDAGSQSVHGKDPVAGICGGVERSGRC